MRYTFALLTAIAFAYPAQADEYDTCLQMTQINPAQAYQSADQWQLTGGGWPAAHCRAMALAGLGRPAQAARELEILAQQISLPEGRAEILTQEAQFWLDAGELAKARMAIDAAISTETPQVQTFITGSRIAAAEGNWIDAIDHLDIALEALPEDVEALALRAAALRKLGRTLEALADANHAAELDPANPLVAFEKGAILAVLGQREEARAEWILAINLDPASPAAAMARANIDRLDQAR